MATILNPSPSRTYVLKTFSSDFKSVSFKRFVLPEEYENTCSAATTFFYRNDLYSCGESAYPIEMHGNVNEMQKGFVFNQD